MERDGGTTRKLRGTVRAVDASAQMGEVEAMLRRVPDVVADWPRGPYDLIS